MIRRTVVALAALAVLAFAIPSFAGKDDDFHAVVRAFEAQYGVRHMRIPFIGFASLCVRVGGTPGFKLAVFEHIGGVNGISTELLEQSLQGTIKNPWRPLVRVRERNELTMIYTNADDKKLKVLIVCLDGDEATLVQTKVTASQIRKWMRDPEDAGYVHNDGPYAVYAQGN